MKRLLVFLYQWITMRYIIRRIKYIKYDKLLRRLRSLKLQNDILKYSYGICLLKKKFYASQLNIFSLFFTLFFDEWKEKIDTLFLRGDIFDFSIGSKQKHIIIYRIEGWWDIVQHAVRLSRNSAKILLDWLIDEEFFLPREYNHKKETILIVKECCHHFFVSDLTYFLDRFLSKCKEYHLDQEDWKYSSISSSMVHILEYLAHASSRTDKLEDVADLMIAQEEFNKFGDWNRAINFYFRSGTPTAVQKIKNLGSQIFSEEWCNDYEWRPIGPYTDTLSVELARNICIENNLYDKDPTNELVLFVHRWFSEKE